jgi:hypothetical protein
MSDLEKAILIAETNGQSVYLMTSAFGVFKLNPNGIEPFV